nr:hypothetical protein [Tanacetum cinerariifolium]
MDRENRDEFLAEKDKEQSASHSEQPIEDVPIIDNVNTKPDWMKPVPEEDRPTTLKPDWVIPPHKLSMEECHRIFTDQVDLINPEGHRIMLDIRKPLPPGGPPGQVTIQSQYYFNKDLKYLVSGDKGRRSTLSISKLKAAHYLDFRLEKLVPSFWIESKCEYDIVADYKEYKILEADFKNLHPNDFKDLYLLHLRSIIYLGTTKFISSTQLTCG